MKENIKLSFLWVAIVAGMSSHSLMDVMPLFWNADIAHHTTRYLTNHLTKHNWHSIINALENLNLTI